MFTGIVEALRPVSRIEIQPPGVRLAVDAGATIAHESRLGQSIAVNGCCLTVVDIAGGVLAFDAGPETLCRTNLGQLIEGELVNLERSVALGDRLGGHFVTGHIDVVGTIDERQDDRDWSTFWIRVPPEWTRQMVAKGSIAVDGVSLTLVDVESDRFSVALIPHTLKVTTLGHRKPGDAVNVETDLLAKYVEKQLQGQQ